VEYSFSFSLTSCVQFALNKGLWLYSMLNFSSSENPPFWIKTYIRFLASSTNFLSC
jgi:hypothetical protein